MTTFWIHTMNLTKHNTHSQASLMAQMVKNPPATQETLG